VAVPEFPAALPWLAQPATTAASSAVNGSAPALPPVIFGCRHGKVLFKVLFTAGTLPRDSDIDPVVLAHGRVKSLLAEDDTTAFIQADVCDTSRILSNPDTQRLINFDEPVAVLYFSFLHCIPDDRDPGGLVRQLIDRLAPGSYLGISHLSADDPQVRERVTRFILDAFGGHWGRVRSPEEVAGFFGGLDLVPPGLVQGNEWHPDGGEEPYSSDWFEYGGVARKP
jgi:hypothetical protein